MKEIRCAEVGFFPDCDGVMQGASDEEVMAPAAEHGRGVHSMSDADFTDENVAIIPDTHQGRVSVPPSFLAQPEAR
jgi:predicted small metal-binding protein